MRKEHFEEQTYKTKVLDEIICNKCGKKNYIQKRISVNALFQNRFFLW